MVNAICFWCGTWRFRVLWYFFHLQVFKDRYDESFNDAKSGKATNAIYGNTISKYLNSQASFAKAIRVETHKFGRMLKSDSEILAIDLYASAMYLEIDFASLLERMCSHLKLNSAEMQEQLEKEYVQKQAQAKTKRDADKAAEGDEGGEG